MGDWIQVAWRRRQKLLLKKQGMLVLDAFQGHLMLDVICESCNEC
jgi:hypothetical protein